MKNWKPWYLLIVAGVAVAYEYGFIELRVLATFAFLLAAASFYNTLIIKRELDSQESLEGAWRDKTARKKLDLLASIFLNRK